MADASDRTSPAAELFPLRELPTRQALRDFQERFPDLDPSAVEGYLFLLRVAADVLGLMRTRMLDHGLSSGRFAVLMQILSSNCAGVTPSELAGRTGFTRATITGFVDGLEKDRLVRRKGSRSDRRSLTVHLTPAGERLLHRILPDHFRRISRIMAPLSAKDRRHLVRLLDKVAVGLASLEDGK